MLVQARFRVNFLCLSFAPSGPQRATSSTRSVDTSSIHAAVWVPRCSETTYTSGGHCVGRHFDRCLAHTSVSKPRPSARQHIHNQYTAQGGHVLQ